jgi:hypothetical protein
MTPVPILSNPDLRVEIEIRLSRLEIIIAGG